MFLYARKMNENNALDLIRNYYQFRKEHDLWFRRLEPYDTKIQMALQDGFPSVLPNLDRLVTFILLYIIIIKVIFILKFYVFLNIFIEEVVVFFLWFALNGTLNVIVCSLYIERY